MLNKLVDLDEPSKDKNDSQMSKFRHSGRTQKIIDELNNMYGNTREKILELVESLKQDKRKDHEIKKILLTEVKFMSRASIYNALPPELKREYTKSEPLPKTINVAHKVIDVPSEEREQYNPEEEIKKIGEIRRAELQKQANEDKYKIPLDKSDLIDPLSEEDPKDLEIAFLKEQKAELEEALKKTQQFTPATQLESKPAVLDDDTVFQYLKDRAMKTGDIIDFGRVGSGALVQALAQYKGSFGVVELFGRVVKK